MEVPSRFLTDVGIPRPDTRIHRRYGAPEDFEGWFEVVREICAPEGALSPGGVGLYARVSRTALHKRIKEGRLTAFLFYLDADASHSGASQTPPVAGRPFTLIPVRECRAWVALLKARRGVGPRPEKPTRRPRPTRVDDSPSWRQW